MKIIQTYEHYTFVPRSFFEVIKKIIVCHTLNDQIHKTMISYIFHSKHKNVLGGRAARYDFLNIIIRDHGIYKKRISLIKQLKVREKLVKRFTTVQLVMLSIISSTQC